MTQDGVRRQVVGMTISTCLTANGVTISSTYGASQSPNDVPPKAIARPLKKKNSRDYSMLTPGANCSRTGPDQMSKTDVNCLETGCF